VSFPTWSRLSGGIFPSVNDIPMKRFLIKIDEQLPSSDYEDIRDEFESIMRGEPSYRILDYRERAGRIALVSTMMNAFGLFTTIIAFLVCFFALMASMYANVYEQTKEIGIMRALGLRKGKITAVYMYEAFVLIISSAMTGVIIGIVVGVIFTYQQTLFTQLPLTFTFPALTVILVFIMAIFSALLSALGPIRGLMRLKVVTIIRMTG